MNTFLRAHSRVGVVAIVTLGIPAFASAQVITGIALYEQGRAVVAAIAKRLELATQALAPLPAEPPLPDPKH